MQGSRHFERDHLKMNEVDLSSLNLKECELSLYKYRMLVIAIGNSQTLKFGPWLPISY